MTSGGASSTTPASTVFGTSGDVKYTTSAPAAAAMIPPAATNNSVREPLAGSTTDAIGCGPLTIVGTFCGDDTIGTGATISTGGGVGVARQRPMASRTACA